MEEGNKQENTKENEVIVISYGNNKNAKEGDSLQEAFKKFRKERQVRLRNICKLYWSISILKLSQRFCSVWKARLFHCYFRTRLNCPHY